MAANEKPGVERDLMVGGRPKGSRQIMFCSVFFERLWENRNFIEDGLTKEKIKM